MNQETCSACRLRPTSLHGFCDFCIKIRLTGISSSSPEPMSDPSSNAPGHSPHGNPNYPNMFPNTVYPAHFSNPITTSQLSYPNTQQQPSSTDHSNSFDAQAFKQAAATVAAHNNTLKYPTAPTPFVAPSSSSIELTSTTSSSVFDPFAAAKESRTRNSTSFPPNTNKAKRGRAVSGGGTSSSRPRGRNSGTPAYDASSPVITFICGFETYKTPKWAKQKPIPVTRTIDIYRPQAYEDLRLDLWMYFQKTFVPNDIIDSLDPAGFDFTTLGGQDGSVTDTDLKWWFSQHSSINLIYDHSRYEHSLASKTVDKLKRPDAVPLPLPAEVTKQLKISQCSEPLSLLHTTEDNIVQGVEHFGRSSEPSLVHTRRALSWVPGLQWTVQQDGNTVESDFMVYRWPSDQQQKDGRTHTVQSIELWHPDGPIKLISKTALNNRFNLRIVAPTNTSRLYNAVHLLLQEFVADAKSVNGLSAHVEMWKIINELRLVEHTIVTSEKPADNDDPSEILDVEGPHEVMHVEEFLDQPLENYATSGFFGFPMIDHPSNMHYLMDAFCHWTYQHSKGHRFVTNLRGSGSVLTNPEIHDVDPANVWGSRNGRASAVALMLVQHQCQLGCQLLQLPKLVRIPVSTPNDDLVWQHRQELPDGEQIEARHVDLHTFLAASARRASRKTPPAPPQCLF